MTDFAASFGKPFRQQVAAFRLRLGDLRDTAAWTDIWQTEHDRAFMVAGATKAGILTDLAALVDEAVSQGTGLQAFRRDFRALIADKGWLLSPAGQGTKGGEAWRTKVIYRTNMATSYAAGRYAQLVEAGFPLWVYRHGGSLEPREQHLAWDGLVLPPDHPFWATHAPPNGWGCSCYIVGARSMPGAKRLGGKPDLQLPDNWQAIDPRTGAPVGIDKGWAYAPGASVVETVRLAAARIATLPPDIGRDYAAGLEGIIERAWPIWLADIEAKGRHAPGLAGVIAKDVMRVLNDAGRAPKSAEIMVSPGLIAGPKADRHLAKGDALTSEDWRDLPVRLRSPEAVLLDSATGKLIYVLPAEGSKAQLAITLDYQTVIRRQDITTNMVVSAYRPNLAEVGRRIGSGLLQLLLGVLR